MKKDLNQTKKRVLPADRRMETEDPTGPGPVLLAQMVRARMGLAQTDLDQNLRTVPHVSLVDKRAVVRGAKAERHQSLKNRIQARSASTFFEF